MTFDEMRGGEKQPAALERSARRALHGMVKAKALIALGDGGRAEPHRYFIHPLLIGFWKDETLQAALKADPGAKAAAAKDMAEMFSQTITTPGLAPGFCFAKGLRARERRARGER
ncbi:hypothetical protein XH80_01865 [Bradyrhizobium sp. CCBAU 45384]|nr:hypothetical protein [Bradyrhizobium sp. CCBAU 45384]